MTGKPKYRPAEHHIRLYDWLYDSDAYRSLSTQARAVYSALCRRYFGYNNGRIGLSVREAAAECRIAKDTASRAFGELAEKGFIVLKSPGAFSLKSPHAAEWLLTAYRDDVDGTLPTKAFMAWSGKTKAGPKRRTVRS